LEIVGMKEGESLSAMIYFDSYSSFQCSHREESGSQTSTIFKISRSTFPFFQQPIFLLNERCFVNWGELFSKRD
jgi:hypothetical protein